MTRCSTSGCYGADGHDSFGPEDGWHLSINNTSFRAPSPMRAVTFDLPDVIEISGYTDDTTWNGWVNVWVTPQTRDDIVSVLTSLHPDDEAISDLESLETDSTGYISLNGYCTTESPTDAEFAAAGSRLESSND